MDCLDVSDRMSLAVLSGSKKAYTMQMTDLFLIFDRPAEN